MLGRDRADVGLPGRARADVAMLGPPVTLHSRVGEGVPVGQPIPCGDSAGPVTTST